MQSERIGRNAQNLRNDIEKIRGKCYTLTYDRQDGKWPIKIHHGKGGERYVREKNREFKTDSCGE